MFPRSDFSLSTPGAAAAGLNLFGGLDDRAKNDVYSISVCDFAVTRLYTMGDIPSTRFGHGSAFAGSVVVVWGGDTMSASSHQLRARARYDNGLYFLNLGECAHVASPRCRGVGTSILINGMQQAASGRGCSLTARHRWGGLGTRS